MKNFFLPFLLLLALISNSAFAADTDFGVSGDEELTDSVTVLAVSSVTLPIAELALAYSQKNNLDVNTVFESAGDLVRQLDNGDPADLIIFSNDDWIRNIAERGLIDTKSITVLAKNNLMLVAASNPPVPAKLPLNDALDYIHNRMLMVMANPEDNALGAANKSVLIKTDRWEKFQKFLILAPNSSKTSDLIIKGQTAGIIYATDYYLHKNQLQLVAKIPADFHKPVIYQGAVVVGKNMNDARKFLNFLASPEAQKIFKKYGFIVG